MTNSRSLDERHRKRFGDYEMVPERTPKGTAHLVTLKDGKTIRVKPDAQTSGQKRSRVVSEALKGLQNLSWMDDDDSVFDPELYLVGALARAGLDWEYARDDDLTDVSIEEWLDHWFELNPPAAPDVNGRRDLLTDLANDGWEIVRKDES